MIQADLFLHAAYTIFVPMKTPVDIWAELGARLSSFGQDAASREVIARACQKNDWFEPEEIVDAVRSIREEFLSRDKIERWLACYERPLPCRPVPFWSSWPAIFRWSVFSICCVSLRPDIVAW